MRWIKWLKLSVPTTGKCTFSRFKTLKHNAYIHLHWKLLSSNRPYSHFASLLHILRDCFRLQRPEPSYALFLHSAPWPPRQLLPKSMLASAPLSLDGRISPGLFVSFPSFQNYRSGVQVGPVACVGDCSSTSTSSLQHSPKCNILY